MRRVIKILLMGLVLLLFQRGGIDLFAQGMFNKVLSQVGDELGGSVAQLPDGTFMIRGTNFDTGGWQFIHLDTSGTPITISEFFFKDDTTIYSGPIKNVSVTQDTQLVSTGTLVDTIGLDEIFVIKYSPDGVVSWFKTYQFGVDDIGIGVRQVADGGFIGLGRTKTNPLKSWDIVLFRMDSLGNLLWSKLLGAQQDEKVYTINVCTDGGFIIGGSYAQLIYALKTDSSGKKEWDRLFLPGNAGGCLAIPAMDGGYILTGGMDYLDGKQKDIWAAKLDSEGVLEWETRIRGPYYEGIQTEAIEKSNGNILLGGMLFSQNKTVIVELSANGDSLNSRAYLSELNFENQFYDFALCQDGGIVAVGDEVGQTQDIWVFKTDSLGCDTPGCVPPVEPPDTTDPIDTTVVDTPQVITLWPNPGQDELNLTGLFQFPVSVEIVEASGRAVRREVFPEYKEGFTLQIDATGLKPGLYLIKLQESDTAPQIFKWIRFR